MKKFFLYLLAFGLVFAPCEPSFGMGNKRKSAISSPSLPLVECKRLSIGEERVLNAGLPTSPERSPTNVKMLYRLKRVGEDEYRIWVNPVFSESRTKSTDEELPLNSADLNVIYRKKLQNCYESMNPFLKNPVTGKSIRIDLETGQGEGFAPELPIKIVNAEERGHSEAFSDKFDCATALHETFHWLGLVDEYEEWSLGYDCRFLGPTNVLMSKHFRATQSIMSETIGYKECTCKTQKCVKSLDNWSSSQCPKGSDDGSFHVVSSMSLSFKPGAIQRISENAIRIYTRPVQREADSTLLLPVYFRLVTTPGCQENETYYYCSQNAYATSQTKGGLGCPIALDDLACSSGEWLK